MSNSAFTPTVLAIGSAGGAGELNVVANPSAGAAGTTGWTGVSAISGATSPLNPVVSTGFSISNVAAVESATSGGYYSITAMPSGLQNRKLKVEFYFTTPATDVYRVSVYKGATRVALSTDSGGSTSLPANVTGGKFVAYFDTDTSAAWTVNVTRTSGSTGPCYITNVIVGPGIQPQGAVVGEWQSFTATGSFVANSSYGAVYRRVGDSVEVYVRINFTGAPTNTTCTINLPTGLTVDSNKLVTTQYASQLGAGELARGSTAYAAQVLTNTTTSVAVVYQSALTGQQSLLSAIAPLTITSGDVLSIRFSAPIAEWAGSGTVQLAQNDVEYAASTSGTWDAAASAAQTVYGPDGAPISGALTADRAKIVQFQTPIQAGDRVILEYNANGAWVESSVSNQPFNNTAGGLAYGASITPVSGSNNQVTVQFYQYRIGPSGSNWGTATGAGAWTGATATNARWRVRKSSAGAAVGFGLVSSGQAGLLPASNSNLDDATATRLGLKQYLHGTTYNGGIAPTVTSAQAGFTVGKALFIPYQLQDGGWRVRFNMNCGFTSASLTSISVSTNGLVFSATNQALSAWFAANSISPRSYTNSSAGSLVVDYGPGVTSSGVVISGDVELASKPTWAY